MGPQPGAAIEARPLHRTFFVPTLIFMSKTRTEVLSESRKKGLVAGATTAGAVAAGVLITPFAGVAAAVPAAYLAYKWWKHRAENGIRF